MLLMMLKVIFDEEFIGGKSLSGYCSAFRGRLCPWSSLLRISTDEEYAMVASRVQGSIRASAPASNPSAANPKQQVVMQQKKQTTVVTEKKLVSGPGSSPPPGKKITELLKKSLNDGGKKKDSDQEQVIGHAPPTLGSFRILKSSPRKESHEAKESTAPAPPASATATQPASNKTLDGMMAEDMKKLSILQRSNGSGSNALSAAAGNLDLLRMDQDAPFAPTHLPSTYVGYFPSSYDPQVNIVPPAAPHLQTKGRPQPKKKEDQSAAVPAAQAPPAASPVIAPGSQKKLIPSNIVVMNRKKAISAGGQP
jgi:hypothetical protein